MVEKLLSPKSQFHDVITAGNATVERSSKLTHNGAQPLVVSAANADTGNALTAICVVVVAVHPLASVTATVYVVDADGVTLTELPARGPGIQPTVYPGDPPPGTAFNCVLLPAHITDGVAVALSVNCGGSVTTTVTVAIHPIASVTVTT
jgi:hypothetical protein